MEQKLTARDVMNMDAIEYNPYGCPEVHLEDAPTIYDLVQAAGEAFGEKTFLKYEDRDGAMCEVTFRQTATATRSVAARLSETYGSCHVALLGHNSFEYASVLLGTTGAQSVAIPLDVKLPEGMLADTVNRADTDLLFYDREFESVIKAIQPKCQKVREWVCLQDLSDLLHQYEDVDFTTTSHPEDCALIIFTSGTTGKSKGVMLSHASMIDNVYNHDIAYRVYEQTLLSVLPINHAFCINMDLLIPMRYGYTVAVCHDIRKLFHAFQVFEPHSMRLVPMMMKAIRNRLIMTQKQHPDWSIDQVRQAVLGPNMLRIVCGGGYMSPDLKDAVDAFGLTCLQGYGMTECSPKIAVPYVDNPEKKESVGFIVRGMETRIVDGELQVKSPSVMMGYYKDPERTKEAITEDGWLRTGDLCRIDEDGYVFLVGRAKNLIILSNGENVPPEPIENMFDEDLLVKEVVVREKDDHIVCEIFPNEEYAEKAGVADIPAALQKLVTQKNKNLPQYAQMVELILRKKPFPRTASNKIIRQQATVVAPEQDQKDPEQEAGLTGTLFSIFQTILGTTELTANDNLFSKGLDSLGCVLFLEELETKTGKTMSLNDLLTHKTIASIAALLEGTTEAKAEAHPWQETYPLTNMQKYFGYIIRGHTTGNLPFHYELDSSVNLKKLQSAILTTLDAHPVLKGKIRPDQSGMLAMWRDDDRSVDIPIKLLNEEEWESVKPTLTRPFSFDGEDDLFHIALYEVEGLKRSRKFMAFDIAHIVGDGVTVSMLLEDIDRAYKGEPVEKETYTFYDYALDDLEEDASGAREKTTEYYAELLKGVRFSRSVLTRRLPEPVDTPVQNSIHVNFEKLPVEAIKLYCSHNGVSENVLFLTAFNYAVGIYSDEQDFYTTSIHSGRTDTRWRRVAGPLFRQYFVRNSVIPHETSKSYLQRTGRQVMDTMQIPISVPRHGEMFFQFQGDLFSRTTLAGAPAKLFFTQLDALPFHMMVVEKRGCYAAELRFWENRFDETLLRQFLTSYETILCSLLSEPSARCLKKHLPQELFPKRSNVLILDKDYEEKPFGAWGRLFYREPPVPQDPKEEELPKDWYRKDHCAIYDSGLVARIMPDGTLDYLEDSGRTVMTEGHLGRKYYDLRDMEEKANHMGPLHDCKASLIYDKATNETKLALDLQIPKESLAEICSSYGEEVYSNDILSAAISVTGSNTRAKATLQKPKEVQRGTLPAGATGYPSKDQPWRRYFETVGEKATNFELPKQTLYDFLKASNEERLNYPALNYYGSTVTYKEFFKRIDDTAKALQASGVQPGDVVSVVTVSSVPSSILFYAINKVGAVSNFLNVLSKPEDFTDYFNEAKGKLVFTIDLFAADVLKGAEAADTVEEVIVYDLKQDLPFYIRPFFDSKLEEKPDTSWKQNALTVKWNDFQKRGEGAPEVAVKKDPAAPAVLAHTGGTTGKPKGLLLNDIAFNTVAKCYRDIMPSGFRQDKVALNIVVPFTVYGLSVNLHMPLCLGATNVLIPKFDASHWPTYFRVYRPSLICGIAAYFRPMMTDPKMKSVDLSSLECIAIGGEGATKEFEEEFNDFLGTHGCLPHLSKGYGMTELCASAFTTYPYHNDLGSVGYPHPFNNVLIYDTETRRECMYNEIGEVCVQCATEMLGYLNNDEENTAFHQTHPDGSVWVHTGDLGYINEDGQLFISGRLKRLFLTYRNGRALKVFPNAVEDVLATCEYVQDLCVVPQSKDEFNRPKAFVQLKEDCGVSEEAAEAALRTLADAELTDYMRPYVYEFRAELPRTDIDKVDFTALEKEC